MTCGAFVGLGLGIPKQVTKFWSDIASRRKARKTAKNGRFEVFWSFFCKWPHSPPTEMTILLELGGEIGGNVLNMICRGEADLAGGVDRLRIGPTVAELEAFP